MTRVICGEKDSNVLKEQVVMTGSFSNLFFYKRLE